VSRKVLIFVAFVMGLAAAGCDQNADGPTSGQQNFTPRWVLRDKDGNRMPAQVEPRCGHWSDSTSQEQCDPPEFGSSGHFPCARVIFWEDRYVNLQYDLKSGTIGPCMSGNLNGSESVRDLAPFGFNHVDDKCEGVLFRETLGGGNVTYDIYRDARDVFRAEGKDWYVSSEGCLDPGPCRQWRANTGECVEDFCARICPLKPVPSWIYELMPNPPYSMTVEYE